MLWVRTTDARERGGEGGGDSKKENKLSKVRAGKADMKECPKKRERGGGGNARVGSRTTSLDNESLTDVVGLELCAYLTGSPAHMLNCEKASLGGGRGCGVLAGGSRFDSLRFFFFFYFSFFERFFTDRTRPTLGTPTCPDGTAPSSTRREGSNLLFGKKRCSTKCRETRSCPLPAPGISLRDAVG